MSLARSDTPVGPAATNGHGFIHTRADDLLAHWAERDRLYAQRATPLSDAEVEVIRAQRVREAGYVEPRRRGPVYVRARHWNPPGLGEWS